MDKSQPLSNDSLLEENGVLRARLASSETRLAEVEDVLQAIRSGDVDAVVVSGPQGDQVFTLQGAEYAYRALVEEMSEGAATLDTNGIILYCNQRLTALMGIPMEQIIGGNAENLFPGDSGHTFQALFKQAQNGETCSAELQLKPDESSPVYLSLHAMSSIEPPTLCMVVTDLKERKKNDELLAAGRLASSILESAAEAIAVCDQAGKIITVNESLERLCGFNPLFQAFRKALPLRYSDTSDKAFSIAEALDGKLIRAVEVTLSRSGEKSAFLLLSSSPIRKAGEVIGCVITMTDITERRRAQAAVIRNEKLASMGRMASTIAHEINNPLEIIGQSLYLALTDPAVTHESKSYLELAVVELERVAHITKQTLAFHRDNSLPKDIDLRDLADSVLKFFLPRLKVRGVTVAKRYAEVECIEGFGGEIRQVISNLLSNSMDAVPNNGCIFLRLSRARRRDGIALVRLTIADNGSGIEPENLKTVFEPFFTTKDVIGTGLGLWVTMRIIEKHGARLRVRSRVGIGTVFSMDFPVSGQSTTPIASSSEDMNE